MQEVSGSIPLGSTIHSGFAFGEKFDPVDQIYRMNAPAGAFSRFPATFRFAMDLAQGCPGCASRKKSVRWTDFTE
jgi:hypothetical protein